MARSNRSRNVMRKILKVIVALLCVGGFLYQTMEFFFLYWTYPTVVDIQVTSPSHIDMPAFTFCNHIGYNLEEFCSFHAGCCISQALYKYFGLCKQFPFMCFNEIYPPDLQLMAFNQFSQDVLITPEVVPLIATELTKYLKCEIEFAGNIRSCNMENTIGSFYSTEELPNFCFTIYSLWGKPEKKMEKIERGATMKFNFFLNATHRGLSEGEIQKPKYNLPSSPAVQIAVHSPYYLPSPFVLGSGFITGKSYELQLKQQEKHLLSAPYQTNCTDYMTEWRARGGYGPINQLMFIQECKLNASYAALGCVPTSIDYPHNYTICRRCGRRNKCNDSDNVKDNCVALAENFNQPCDFISYDVDISEKVISIPKYLKSSFLVDNEGINAKVLQHDCEGTNIWNKECSTVDVEVIFERFEITNLTYNPKYESLELFSVVGGYMGMWLGVSLIAVYDFAESLANISHTFLVKRAEKRRQRAEMKTNSLLIHRNNAWAQEQAKPYIHRKTNRMRIASENI